MLKKLFHSHLSFTILIFSLLLCVSFPNEIFTQNRIKGNYQYLSPLPGAVLVQPKSGLIIRQGNYINPSTLNEKYLEVKGSKSGLHHGRLILADDGKSILFKPFITFSLGEVVTVKIKKGIEELNGNFLIPEEYHFKILEKKVNLKNYNSLKALFSKVKIKTKVNIKVKERRFNKTQDDSLPPDFPNINLAVNNNPYPGDIFAAPFVFQPNPEYGYLMILDRNAIPIFYRRFNYPVFDFKLQVDGLLTYRGPDFKYYFLDSSYSIIDSLTAGNGYLNNIHEKTSRNA